MDELGGPAGTRKPTEGQPKTESNGNAKFRMNQREETRRRTGVRKQKEDEVHAYVRTITKVHARTIKRFGVTCVPSRKLSFIHVSSWME